MAGTSGHEARCIFMMVAELATPRQAQTRPAPNSVPTAHEKGQPLSTDPQRRPRIVGTGFDLTQSAEWSCARYRAG
jgi:hypothetical protein